MQPKYTPLSPSDLKKAGEAESEAFEKTYRWIEHCLPPSFHEEIDAETKMLIARNLLSFKIQNHFLQIFLKDFAVVLCLDGPDADLKILKLFSEQAIRHYRAFVSNAPPPGEEEGKLRVAMIGFQDVEGTRFERSMPPERMKIAMELLARAKTRDQCQYELKKNEDWQSKHAPSLQLIMAWRNVPKAGFLYRLAKVIDAHGLALQKVAATYIDPHKAENISILSLGLHGRKGGTAWDEADLDDFLREVCLLKFFEAEDAIATTFVQPRLTTGNEGHLIRNFISYTHQVLCHADPNLYSFDNIVEGLCRHPELTTLLCKAFEAKFHPQRNDLKRYSALQKEIASAIESLDTGQAGNDARRKNIYKQALGLIEYTFKTNFYRKNKSAFSFRLSSKYLDNVPYNRKEKFPALPFGVFFVRGMHFLGFNIRFEDLARGGFRTVAPEKWEQYSNERNNIFAESYNLAYTQQKKNKDIPEGGAKTVILLKPIEVFAKEEEIYRKELVEAKVTEKGIEEKLQVYRKEHRQAYLFASQRAFIESLMTLIHCDEKGHLLTKDVIDYYQKPEYLYIGPDENASNELLVWIAKYAVEKGYKPGRSFISSKPGSGINHKEYGVTSYGVNIYLQQTLLHLGIDPETQPFTIKISGGPDGDVAGNEILNLRKYYPTTAKLIAVTDVSGTIYDPEGLDLEEMEKLFRASLPLRHYPPQKLTEGGFLLDLRTKREENSLSQETLLWKKKGGEATETWISGNEMNHLFRNNLHQTPADVFIPCGGRPRTLNESNVESYLDASGHPTSKAIVEGANLYLTPGARSFLEKKGVLILKDSSCNKGGVICSSMEVLSGLCMSEEDFIKEKKEYVEQVLAFIGEAALNEARLLFDIHKETGKPLTEISDEISERINQYKDQLLHHFRKMDLPRDPEDPLMKALFSYCLPILRDKYREGVLSMPEIHKKAILAAYLGSHAVYKHGLRKQENIVNQLPSLLGEL